MNMRDTACLVETHNLFTSCTKHHELQSERGTSCVPNLVAQNPCTMVKIQFKMYNLVLSVQGAAVTIQIEEIEKFFSAARLVAGSWNNQVATIDENW